DDRGRRGEHRTPNARSGRGVGEAEGGQGGRGRHRGSRAGSGQGVGSSADGSRDEACGRRGARGGDQRRAVGESPRDFARLRDGVRHGDSGAGGLPAVGTRTCCGAAGPATRHGRGHAHPSARGHRAARAGLPARAGVRRTGPPGPPRQETRYGVVCDPGPAAHDGTMGRAWHEGAVGTLAFYDADGERLDTIYLARMPEPYKKTLVGELEAELRSVLRERSTMNVVWASDGADPQWQALEGIETRLPPECTGNRMKLVDAFHVAEYVQKAADAIWGPSSGDAHVQAVTWRETIKSKRDGPAEVLRSMRARLGAPRTASGRKELREAID